MNLPSSKVIITATVAPTWVFVPEIRNVVEEKWRQTTESLVSEIVACRNAGAAIVHVHGNAPWSRDKWQQVIQGVRSATDILIQVGLSGRPMEERRELLDLKPDMCSVRLTHSDERYTVHSANLLHTMDEIKEYLLLCREKKVKPELECHNEGALWNLNYILGKGWLELPAFLTLFLGWPGGTWTPPTMEELISRVKLVPKGCIYQTSIMPDNPEDGANSPFNLSLLTVMLGGHVRVGTEDYPYIHDKTPAKDASELVRRIADGIRALGKGIATPEEARTILGLG
ncbi:MAG: 3-keto-5-aminohexanoate cleavage protein [Conexivisphaerales archaeon]